MKKIIFVTLIIIILTACSNLKIGEDYYLIHGTTVAFDKEVAKKLQKARGTNAYITISSNNKTQRVELGTKVQLIEEDGGICGVNQGSTTAYVSCDSFVKK